MARQLIRKICNTCTGKFPLVSLVGLAEGPVCADLPEKISRLLSMAGILFSKKEVVLGFQNVACAYIGNV